MTKKPKRERTARRERARDLGKVSRDRERLFALGPGGSSESPIAIDSPAVVEPKARAIPCPRCGGEHEVVEHVAVTRDGARVREARLRCRGCRSRRSLWFRLPVLN